MNVASLENCKELYELSGWDDTDWSYTSSENGDMFLLDNDDKPHIPAYDLGYLLRKITVKCFDDDFADGMMLNCDRISWTASYDSEYLKFPLVAVADTPEDAAAKLAIELFKQGILTREQS